MDRDDYHTTASRHACKGYTRALARCYDELAHAEALLREGHPEVEGLTRAIADWAEEARLIAAEAGHRVRVEVGR